MPITCAIEVLIELDFLYVYGPAMGPAPRRGLAAHLRMPAPDDTASTPVVAHLESAIRLAADAQLPNGPLLLVASTVRTRWAATMAAALLREQGAPQVLLLALHLQP
jgi:hypothetical protein